MAKLIREVADVSAAVIVTVVVAVERPKPHCDVISWLLMTVEKTLFVAVTSAGVRIVVVGIQWVEVDVSTSGSGVTVV